MPRSQPKIRTLNKRIKEIRLSGEYNQDEFSKILGVTQATVSLMESRPAIGLSIDVIDAICSKFKVDANWLLYGIGQMKMTPSNQEIKVYKSKITELEKTISDKETIIRLLMKKEK